MKTLNVTGIPDEDYNNVKEEAKGSGLDLSKFIRALLKKRKRFVK